MNKDKEYSIEVLMEAHKHCNANNPYFWSILEITQDRGKIVFESGWEVSPMMAWAAAIDTFNRHADEWATRQL